MSERDPSDRDERDSDAPEDERGEEFEAERTATRAEAAAVLRGLADGVDAGAVSIGAGEDAVAAVVPDEFDFEVEYERDDEEVEIEVELEWSPDDEPAERDAVAVDEQEMAGESETADTDDESTAEPVAETATVATADAGGEGSAEMEGGSDAGDAVATPPVAAVPPVVSQARFELFRDRAAEWRWRLVHRNGNVIAASGEGYTRKHNAEKGLRSVMRNAPDADVFDEE